MTRRRTTGDEDPFAVLGLSSGAGADAIHEARRRLAKELHPDVGGSLAAMQRVNAAAERALSLDADARPEPGGARPPRSATSRRRRPTGGSVRHDHPSFTIEALPAEAFEALLVVAAWLGEPIDDDPPYLLEVALAPPHRGWCRVELVPDAGASTVSLAVAPEPGYPAPDVDAVRDTWIDGLNRLDWSDPESPRPPS